MAIIKYCTLEYTEEERKQNCPKGCQHCSWNSAEIERRKAIPTKLVPGKDGLLHLEKIITCCSFEYTESTKPKQCVTCKDCTWTKKARLQEYFDMISRRAAKKYPFSIWKQDKPQEPENVEAAVEEEELDAIQKEAREIAEASRIISSLFDSE